VQSRLTSELLAELRNFDTCLLADAIESFGVRLRNEGYATGKFRCLFKRLPPMVGYASTCKVRSADPPVVGDQYAERTDWWKELGKIPAPRVVVMQDLDRPPGIGAFFGKVHANILRALGCVGVVTDGAARELPEIEEIGFHIFAGRIALSRAYIHIVDWGEPVEIGGLTIRPGDLLHGDRHGIMTVPPELAPRLPAAARLIEAKKQQLITLSRQSGVTGDKLGQGLKELYDLTMHDGVDPWKR